MPEACAAPDPPLAWAVAQQRDGDAPLSGVPLTGVVLRLDLDGLAWSRVAELPRFDPMGIDFVDCEWGWMVGTATLDAFNTQSIEIYATVDGGTSWSTQTTHIDRASFAGGFIFHGVRAVSRARAVVFGTRPVGPDPITDTPPLILLTEDGGESWRAAEILAAPEGTTGGDLRSSRIYELCFTRSGIGIASGGGIFGNLTLLSSDAGATWHDITATVQGGIACSGDRGLWAVGDGIRHSPDGGRTWVDLTDRLPASLAPSELGVPPSFVDARTGWLVAQLRSGARAVLQTTDEGETWTELAELSFTSETRFGTRLDFSTSRFGIANGHRTDDTGSRFAAAALTRDGGATWKATTFADDVLIVRDLALVP